MKIKPNPKVFDLALLFTMSRYFFKKKILNFKESMPSYPLFYMRMSFDVKKCDKMACHNFNNIKFAVIK